VSAQLFAALAALAREEHAIVTDGRFEELAGLNARRDLVLSALPPSAPPEALEHLREAARLQGLVAAALRDARDETGAELLRLRRTRTGVQGYAAGMGAAAPQRPAYSQLG
jgi:hypothetical protein